MGGSLVSGLEVLAGKDGIGSAESPRAGDGDHAGSMMHFVSGSLDLEVRHVLTARHGPQCLLL